MRLSLNKARVESSRFFLSRFFERLNGPRKQFWLVAIIASFGPVLTLLSIDSIIIPFENFGSFLLTSFAISLFVIYFLYSLRFILMRIERLADYTRRILGDNSMVQSAIQYRPGGILAIWFSFLGANTLLFGLPDFATEHVTVIAYVLLVLSLFLWAYGYSMLTIYRAGKLPLQLRPFTEDRTLGLRPYGTTSLQLASVYAVIPIIITIISQAYIIIELPGTVSVTVTSPRPSDIIFLVGLMLVGVVLFFMPLISIHRKLLEAKQRELAWIGPRYSELVRRLRETSILNPADNINEAQALANELTVMRQLQQDAQRIQGWPFDLSIITKLATVLVLPPILTVVARILVLAFLRI